MTQHIINKCSSHTNNIVIRNTKLTERAAQNYHHTSVKTIVHDAA